VWFVLQLAANAKNNFRSTEKIQHSIPEALVYFQMASKHLASIDYVCHRLLKASKQILLMHEISVVKNKQLKAL